MLKTNFLQMELYNLFVSKMTVKQGKSLLDQEASLGLAKVKLQSSEQGSRREFKILLMAATCRSFSKEVGSVP